MTAPLEGIRVVEYAQYVAGPLCGVLLADLGAEVVKVEPPRGDAYRQVMPVAPGVGRYFLPLNRGKRSVVLDLKTDRGRSTSRRLLESADVLLHNFPLDRAQRFGLDWDAVHAAHPAAVLGIVSSFGRTGPLAGAPAYDLVAQARAGLLTAHASPGDRVPVRAGGIPMADLTAGFLLATGVLAALVRARESRIGELVEVSLLAAALAVQLQDLVWLPGEIERGAGRGTSRAQLESRAAEIAGGVAMNPYYRCFETADGFLAVACLNLAQRSAFLDLFGLEDPTIDAPDLVPDDQTLLTAKETVTAEIEREIAGSPTEEWLARLEAAGVPCGLVQTREGVHADPQVIAAGLVGQVDQPDLGDVRMLAPFVRFGGSTPGPAPAPALGADTEAVLGGLERR
ncbi:MAG TPA: CoA transferase [Gaiellaceae bacterium]|nr:CoA transferase [Gaiellaceae bacterium]